MLPNPAPPPTSLTTPLPLVTGSLSSSHPLNVPHKVLHSDRFLPSILSYRIHSQVFTPIFSFYANLSPKPQMDTSNWVSRSIPDAVYSKPHPFSFLADLIRMLSPSQSPRLKTQASSITFFTLNKSIWFLSPLDSTFPVTQSDPHFLLPLLLSSAGPLTFPQTCQSCSLGFPASLPYLQSATKVMPASLTLQSPTQMGHSLV